MFAYGVAVQSFLRCHPDAVSCGVGVSSFVGIWHTFVDIRFQNVDLSEVMSALEMVLYGMVI